MQFNEALEVVHTYGIQMITEPGGGLAGVAVGVKSGGPLKGESDFCITAFVEKKISERELEAENVTAFNAVFASAASVGGEKPPKIEDLNVVETGSAFSPLVGLSIPVAQRGLYGGNPPALNAQKWFSGLRAGIGITNPADSYPNGLSVGTAGFYMIDEDGNYYVVSNNHVIGGSNDATIGDIVVQPGTLDLTGNELQAMPTLADLNTSLGIAQLTAIAALDFSTQNNVPINHVDAAIANLTESGRSLNDIDRLTFGGGIRGVAEYTVDEATGAIEQSDRVYKVGRTTGYTEGNIVNLGGTVTIKYDGGHAYFTDQIIIEATPDNVGPFSDSGDSGSGILNDSHELIGLLFAGSTLRTIANPITDVIDELRTAAGIDSLEVCTI